MKNKINLVLTIFLICSQLSFSQDFFTEGDQSPIINGTKAYVEYLNESEVNMDIPDQLTPVLAGLLLANDKSLEEAQPALEVWVKKYQELRKRIDAQSDVEKKKNAYKALQQSDFTKVEEILNIRTNYNQLINTFGNSYRMSKTTTIGDQSPVIIGDQATVKYVVNQVVKYRLPEGVTVNLLNELKSSRQTNLKLETDIRTKERVIIDWIERYQELDRQLKNTPGKLAQEAYKYFQLGDLAQAMKVLQKIDSSKEEIGKASFLQAQILGLQLESGNMDELSKRILKYYQQAASLTEDFEIHVAYAHYLTDNQSDPTNSLRVIQGAKDYAKTDLEQFKYKAAESYFYYYLSSREFSENSAKEALKLSEKLDFGVDTLILYTISSLQTQMANLLNYKAEALRPSQFNPQSSLSGFTQQDFDKINQLIKEALVFDSLSIVSLERLITFTKGQEENIQTYLMTCKSNVAVRSGKIYPPAKALLIYDEVHAYMQEKYKLNKWYNAPKFVGFLNAYSFYLLGVGEFEKAESILKESADACADVLDTGTKGTYNYYASTMYQYVSVLGINNKFETSLEQTRIWQKNCLDFFKIDPATFEASRQMILYQLADMCYRTGRAEEGVAYCEELVEAYESVAIPVYQNVLNSANSITQLSLIGYHCYKDKKDFTGGIAFLQKIDALLDKLRTVSGDFHVLIDSRKMFLQSGILSFDHALGKEKDYESILNEQVAKCKSNVIHDPQNSIVPYISSTSTLSNIRTKDQSFSQDELLVKKAKIYFYQAVPPNMQSGFFINIMGMDNDILRHYIRRGQLVEAKEQAEYMEMLFSTAKDFSNQWPFIQPNGDSGMFLFRQNLVHGYCLIAECYFENYQKEENALIKAALVNKTCSNINLAWDRLEKDWNNALAREVRKRLIKMDEECECGLIKKKIP